MAVDASPKRRRSNSTLSAAARRYVPPLTISRRSLLTKGRDVEFRDTIYLMIEILHLFDSCNAVFGRTLGIAGSQFSVLIGVAFRQGDNGTTISSLAKYIQLASNQVTTEVSALARKGLLVKRAGTEDRRSVLVKLSPEGEAAVARVVPLIRKVNDLLFDEISRAQMDELKQIFTRLSHNSEFTVAEIRRYERDRHRRES